ncbi:MAG: hypothetical protein HUU55_13025 [Myxococcales bacterium]|nr:hypothetical protein [Myxococcales bacterium]
MKNRKKLFRVVMAAATAIAGLWSASAAIAAPQMTRYVAELTDTMGNAVDGSVTVSVALYAAQSGGTAAWSQNLGSKPVDDGLFDIKFGNAGSGDFGEALSGGAIWIEFTINGEVMTPRQRLSSAPFAMEAGHADHLDGLPASDYATQDWLSTYKIPQGNLPDDGLDEVSNGTISNEFIGVIASSSEVPANVPDNVPGGVNVALATQEALGSRMTAVIVSFTLNISFVSKIKVTLNPSGPTGVGPIVLMNQTLTPAQSGTYQYTPNDIAGLAALIDTDPSGTWVLNVADIDLTGGSANAVVTEFELSYNVIRADGLNITGRLDVSGELNIDGNLGIGGNFGVGGTATLPTLDAAEYLKNGAPLYAGQWGKTGADIFKTGGLVGFGQATPTEQADISGNLRVTGEVFRRVQVHYADADEEVDNGTVGGYTFTFNKKRSDTSLKLTWSDNIYIWSGTSYRRALINGQACSHPREMMWGHHAGGGGPEHKNVTMAAYCDKVGGNPIPAGNHVITFTTQSDANSYLGWSQGTYITIDEVYTNYK